MSPNHPRRSATPRVVALVAAVVLLAASTAAAQRGRGGRGAEPAVLRQAAQLDLAGKTSEARALYDAVLDTISDPAARANVQRAEAMSYAFDGDCANTIRHEQMVIDYWTTREKAEPQNAFYQEGEMADEGARVCIDAGDLDTAEKWYRLGYTLGNREPEPRTHSKSLWDYRLAHALGRIAARRGDAAEARAQIANARKALDSDSAMAAQQERFFPYLVGYVALYTGNLKTAESEFQKMLAMRGNANDPFMNCLLAETYEKMGDQARADALYQKAYDLARAHNPPAAYARRVARAKLGDKLGG